VERKIISAMTYAVTARWSCSMKKFKHTNEELELARIKTEKDRKKKESV
tara:strand:- start:51 stop:197 length:147 start_codon:yes stop_codon:yes gene_type:complete